MTKINQMSAQRHSKSLANPSKTNGAGKKPPSDTLKVVAAASPDPTPKKKGETDQKCPNGHSDIVEPLEEKHTSSDMLTPEELADLQKREAVIVEASGGSDLLRGQELLAILISGYHRKTGHPHTSKKIEEYAVKRFGNLIGSSHRNVQRLLSLAKAYDKGQKCPSGHLLDWDREGPIRTLVDRHNKPDFEHCVEATAAAQTQRAEDAKRLGVQPKAMSGPAVEKAVNLAVTEYRAAQFDLRPRTKRQLTENFHVTRVEDGLPFIADGACDLVMTSFPYGVNINYMSHGEVVWNDSISLAKLLDSYTKWIKVIERITDPNHGRVILNIADVYNCKDPMNRLKLSDENVVYLDYEIDQIIRHTTDMKRYGKIFWDKGDNNNVSLKSGSVASYSCPAIERQAEILLVYYRGSRQRSYEVDRKDMDTAEYMGEPKRNIWRVNAVSGNPTHNRQRIDRIHPCPYPVKLCANAIKLFTAAIGPNGEQDTVCDPLGGSGSLAVAATRLGRKFIYNDASQEYAEYAMDRVADELKAIEASKGERNDRPSHNNPQPHDTIVRDSPD